MGEKINIPFFGIDRMYAKYSDQILERLHSVYSDGRVLQGPEISEFEEGITKYCGRKFGVSVGSCTDALYFALKSAGVNQSDEVLVTSFSFIASASPIVRIGAVPVFVDIEPDYYMMNLNDLESKITNKTKAIIAVHLFGQTLPIDEIEEIAVKNNLILIEDAAQSLGSKYKNRMAGSMGLCSCISFDPTKVIGAFGSGGVLLTDNEDIYSTVKKLRYHGKNTNTGVFEIFGFNSQLASGKAALLSLQLDLLEDWIKRRREIAGIYSDELSDIEEINLPKIRDGAEHIYHKFVISTKNRDNLRNYLKEKGIQIMVHYNKTIYENPSFNSIRYKADGLSIVHDVKKSVLSLPLYPELKNDEVLYICDAIKAYFTNYRN